jgi:hypothetical protein
MGKGVGESKHGITFVLRSLASVKCGGTTAHALRNTSILLQPWQVCWLQGPCEALSMQADASESPLELVEGTMSLAVKSEDSKTWFLDVQSL